MTELIIIAFTMGLAGSIHCVGMCGPLALALPLRTDLFSKFGGTLLYNLGRVTTYGAFGLLFGLIGRTSAWFGWQQKLSILLGLIILAFLFIPHNWLANPIAMKTGWILSKWRKLASQLLSVSHSGSLYALGLVNGLLPCGLVYLAIGAAVVTGTAWKGSLFMVCFGLGTLPAMWAVSFFGNWIQQPLRSRIMKIYPAIVFATAVLLILRGLNLGIPYISPEMNISATASAGCHPE